MKHISAMFNCICTQSGLQKQKKNKLFLSHFILYNISISLHINTKMIHFDKYIFITQQSYKAKFKFHNGEHRN